MSDETRPRARYRFDPLTDGVFLGLGQLRAAALLGVLGLGLMLLLGGDHVLLGTAVLLVGPIPVFWTREGLPIGVWLLMRAEYRLTSERERGWSLDPELVPHRDPAPETPTPEEG
jgi:hypothetical protein